MSVTTIRLPPNVEQSLEAMSKQSGHTKSWLVKQALQEYIQRRQEEETRWADTLKAMESVAQGKVVSSDAVHAWLQSWGSPNELPTPKTGQ